MTHPGSARNALSAQIPRPWEAIFSGRPGLGVGEKDGSGGTSSSGGRGRLGSDWTSTNKRDSKKEITWPSSAAASDMKSMFQSPMFSGDQYNVSGFVDSN